MYSPVLFQLMCVWERGFSEIACSFPFRPLPFSSQYLPCKQSASNWIKAAALLACTGCRMSRKHLHSHSPWDGKHAIIPPCPQALIFCGTFNHVEADWKYRDRKTAIFLSQLPTTILSCFTIPHGYIWERWINCKWNECRWERSFISRSDVVMESQKQLPSGNLWEIIKNTLVGAFEKVLFSIHLKPTRCDHSACLLMKELCSKGIWLEQEDGRQDKLICIF